MSMALFSHYAETCVLKGQVKDNSPAFFFNQLKFDQLR